MGILILVGVWGVMGEWFKLLPICIPSFPFSIPSFFSLFLFCFIVLFDFHVRACSGRGPVGNVGQIFSTNGELDPTHVIRTCGPGEQQNYVQSTPGKGGGGGGGRDVLVGPIVDPMNYASLTVHYHSFYPSYRR